VMAREAGTLPAELTTTSAWVLDHERALIDFARRELAGATAHSLDWPQAMLTRAVPATTAGTVTRADR